MMENNEIMQIEEVMEYLNIGKNTMYGLLKSGELNAFKIGKVWKIPKASVEDYVRRKIEKNAVGNRCFAMHFNIPIIG